MIKNIHFHVTVLVLAATAGPSTALAQQVGPGASLHRLVTIAAEHAAKPPAERERNGEIEPAQPTMPFTEGARVRVIAPMLPAPLYGRALRDRVNPDRFVVVTAGGDARVSMPLASASRIDVSQGRARAKTAQFGALVGFLAAVLDAGDGDVTQFSDDLEVMFAGVGGALLGAGAGAAFAPERWRTVHTAVVANPSYDLVLADGAHTKHLGDGTLAVRGERNRRVGTTYGLLALGGIAAVFGGRDYARGDMGGSEYASAVISNAVIGAAVGYFVSPRRWQKLPPPLTGRQ